MIEICSIVHSFIKESFIIIFSYEDSLIDIILITKINVLQYYKDLHQMDASYY